MDTHEKNRIFSEITDYLRINNGLKDIPIVGESKLIYDLGLNSYELVEMCVQIEALFDITTDESDFRDMKTVADVVAYIYDKKASS